MGDALMQLLIMATKGLTGKTLAEHVKTTDPRFLPAGKGSAHHLSAAKGATERVGFVPAQLLGWGMEGVEGLVNPAGGSMLSHFAAPDTGRDLVANLIGGLYGIPGAGGYADVLNRRYFGYPAHGPLTDLLFQYFNEGIFKEKK